jgi:hypothetical protein
MGKFTDCDAHAVSDAYHTRTRSFGSRYNRCPFDTSTGSSDASKLRMVATR